MSLLDGRDEKGKTVSNPNIGYGSQTTKYADGKTKEFYQIGISANTTGISVFVMGLNDKKYLTRAFGQKLGKASVTGYCIKFKRLADIKSTLLKSRLNMELNKQALNTDSNFINEKPFLQHWHCLVAHLTSQLRRSLASKLAVWSPRSEPTGQTIY